MSIDRMQTLIKTREDWLNDRPVMAENNLDLKQILHLLQDEVCEAMETTLNGDGNFDDQNKAIEQELSDIAWFLLTAYRVLEMRMGTQPGVLLYDSMMEKHARNVAKYPAYLFDGSLSYPDAMELSRLDWRETGGNHDFYNGKNEPINLGEGVPVEAPAWNMKFMPAGYELFEGKVRSVKDIEEITRVRAEIQGMVEIKDSSTVLETVG